MWIKWVIELVMDVMADLIANLFTNGKNIKNFWKKDK